MRKKAKFYPTSRRVSVPINTTSHTYVSITAPATCRRESRTSSSQRELPPHVHRHQRAASRFTMSFIRARSIAQLRAVRIAHPVNARFFSTPTDGSVKVSPADAPTTPPKDSSLINKEAPGEAMARHQPDYNATIDHATSYVLPSFVKGDQC